MPHMPVAGCVVNLDPQGNIKMHLPAVKNRCLWPAVIICCLLIIPACGSKASGRADEQAASDPVSAKKISARLILKFRDHVTDPSREEYVKKLSDVAGVRLTYLRAMSGGAHVFSVPAIDEKAHLEEIINRLSGLPDVLYVEPDRKMTHQN
ncbi:MAG: hypothetical protein WBJ50_06725 [Smithellaceae bacterium]